jgi:hypothetical protein
MPIRKVDHPRSNAAGMEVIHTVVMQDHRNPLGAHGVGELRERLAS